MTRSSPALWLALLAACTPTPAPMDASLDVGADAGTTESVARHSSAIAIAGDLLYVANADADSITVIDTVTRTRTREIALTNAAPIVDPVTGRFDPAVRPRALAVSADHAWITGQGSGELIEIDLAAGSVSRRVHVGAEPIGIVISADATRAYVACAADASVVEVDLTTLTIARTFAVAPKPWALAWSADDATLYASHLLGPGVTAIDVRAATTTLLPIPDAPARGDRLLAHGQVRGLYDVIARPGTSELWVPHLLLATDTPQVAPPAAGLDFESTVFPAITALDRGAMRQMTVDARVPGVDGQLGDVVSGPHAIAFTRDGRFAFVLDAQSEDVLVIDAARGVEVALVRPLPGHLPEGLVLSPDETRLYVQERASSDVAVLSVRIATDPISGIERPFVEVDGAAIPLLARDPMPPTMRLGQTLFFTANSDAFPITQNHWVACASCHLEARSDAVVWRFTQGPRDTPSNAGGTMQTGFLFRTADRRSIRDYWHTIEIEQGGSFDPVDPTRAMQLDALTAFVDRAIPLPTPPTLDASIVARGRAIFERADVGCATCHGGPALTDSGAGNPSLDLAGTVLLHDVGTCNAEDVAHTDVDGHPREACAFDTPSLRGVADSWPYLHDGSAPTLRDVLERTRGRMGDIDGLDEADLDALVTYLRSL